MSEEKNIEELKRLLYTGTLTQYGKRKLINYYEKEIEKLQKENKELKEDIKEYEKTFDIFNERTYRKKYLEERRAEQPNLLFPDADEIYKRYYELKEENDILKTNYGILKGDIQKVVNKLGFPEDTIISEEFIPMINENYFPKQKIKDKIKKLEWELDFYAGREHAEWQDGEFDGEVCDDISLKIRTLKELLEEK